MDYTRMLCWIRPNEKKDLEVAVAGRFPLVFAKNYLNFILQLRSDKNTYPVISFGYCNNLIGIIRIKLLMKLFPNIIFRICQLGADELITDRGIELMILQQNTKNIGKILKPSNLVEDFKS
ncbi:hypothetical protein AGMMS49944_20490 [Spirochaetia bacterium]|nr:hypothetical protein AGMMS49944_20490 [Spirochaetia bacterium]